MNDSLKTVSTSVEITRGVGASEIKSPPAQRQVGSSSFEPMTSVVARNLSSKFQAKVSGKFQAKV